MDVAPATRRSSTTKQPLTPQAFGVFLWVTKNYGIRMSVKNILLLGLLICLPCASAHALMPADQPSWGQFERDFDEKPWSELESRLPPPPRQENLLPFFVSAASSNQFFVDGSSLSSGTDGVVRYTLIVQSPSGVRNISFEGMRCATAEFKRYAFGREDGSWGRAKNVQWTPIQYKDLNRQHHMLFDDFLCPRGFPVKSLEEAIQAFRAGIHFNAISDTIPR